jgi:hypothetical protein
VTRAHAPRQDDAEQVLIEIKAQMEATEKVDRTESLEAASAKQKLELQQVRSHHNPYLSL